MKYYSFTLSMPGCNSWNGKWSGEDRQFVIVKKFREGSEIARALKDYYSYNFGDGWRAGVEVKQIDGKEARILRRKSAGFCGYDWMVDSILGCGEIKVKPALSPHILDTGDMTAAITCVET